ncbi:MAG TPA: O-antigen ligase family protein [Vicinamibacterales bacterium]|nr:O-antigen ligase family protein [Vicinamibacterales bacterium]
MKGLIFVYVLTAFGTIAALRKPLYGLFVYVGFAVLRPQFLWGFAGNFERISQLVGLATLVGWALHGCGSMKFGRGRSIVVALGVYAVWSMLSAAQAVDTNVSYAEMIGMAKWVMPFFIGATLIDTNDRARALFWIIVLAQAYVAFNMNWEYWFHGFNNAGDGFGGMDNNCYGVSLVTTLGPAFVLAVGTKKWWERGLAVASAALILHTTLLTFSRGALLGLLSVGAATFFIMPKRPKHLAALVVIALVAIRFTGPQLAARYATTVADEDQRDTSAESRVDLWRDCFKVALGKPMFGVGPGNFKVISASLGWTAGKQAHSTWMQTMAENGFPGVIALFLFFVIAMIKLWPIARAKVTDENRDHVILAAGIITSIVGFAVSGQFVSLAGLEIPYYVTMIGVFLLKQVAPTPSLATAHVRPLPGAQGRWAPAGHSMARPRNWN